MEWRNEIKSLLKIIEMIFQKILDKIFAHLQIPVSYIFSRKDT